MRIIFANGGLPVLAAAAVLIGEGGHLQPGAETSLDGVDFEVDILGWCGRQLFAGEVKRSAAGFGDVNRDISNSRKFGADVHIAATIETVDDALRERLEEACKAQKMQLRLLDASALLLFNN